MEKVHILLPVHNRKDVTRRFIECLKDQTYNNYHLILIDDGSTDGTEEMVREQIQSLTVIKGRGNWWWAGSLQQGYLWLKSQKISLSDIVLIINDDTEFEKDFIDAGVSAMRRNENALLLASSYSKQTGQLIDSGIHIDWGRFRFEQAYTSEHINCLSTRGLFLRVTDFYKTGGFYPRLLPHYASDYEFTIRAYRKGIKLVTDPMLKLRADEQKTGYHLTKEQISYETVKNIFSLKSTGNPLYGTVFIALSCPWRWKIVNFVRVWSWPLYGLYLMLWKLSKGRSQ